MSDGHAAAFGLLADQLKTFLNELHPAFMLAVGNETGSQLPPFEAAQGLKAVAFVGQCGATFVVLARPGSADPSAGWDRLVGILENGGRLLQNMPREALVENAVDPEAIRWSTSDLGYWLAGVMMFQSDVRGLQNVPPGSWVVVEDLVFASAALLNRLLTPGPVPATVHKQHEAIRQTRDVLEFLERESSRELAEHTKQKLDNVLEALRTQFNEQLRRAPDRNGQEWQLGERVRRLLEGIMLLRMDGKTPNRRFATLWQQAGGRLGTIKEARKELDALAEMVGIPGDSKPTRDEDRGATTGEDDKTGRRAKSKGKRSTVKGEGREKLIGALTKHHQYADGGCLNQEPVGNNELALKPA